MNFDSPELAKLKVRILDSWILKRSGGKGPSELSRF